MGKMKKKMEMVNRRRKQWNLGPGGLVEQDTIESFGGICKCSVTITFLQSFYS